MSLIKIGVDSLTWSSCTSEILIITYTKLLRIESSRTAHFLELIIIKHLVEIEWPEEIIHKLLLLLPFSWISPLLLARVRHIILLRM